MSKTQSLFCLGLFGISFVQSSFWFWGLLAAIPLFMVAAAIVHHRVTQKKQGVQWLVLFYILSFAVQPILWIVLIFGFSDAWVNYRRLSDQAPSQALDDSSEDIEPKDSEPKD